MPTVLEDRVFKDRDVPFGRTSRLIVAVLLAIAVLVGVALAS